MVCWLIIRMFFKPSHFLPSALNLLYKVVKGSFIVGRFNPLLSFFQNGVLLRTVLDPVTGDLSDTRTRYLGSRPVKLFRVRMQGQEAVSNEQGQQHVMLEI